MVILIQTAFGGAHNQVCDISITNAIMIPLGVGWSDTGGNLDGTYDPSTRAFSSSVSVGVLSVYRSSLHLLIFSSNGNFKLSSICPAYLEAFNKD
jgi:hypothetical protein